MKHAQPIENQILDRLMEKLKADPQVPAKVIARLNELRELGELTETARVLQAYHQEAARDIN